MGFCATTRRVDIETFVSARNHVAEKMNHEVKSTELSNNELGCSCCEHPEAQGQKGTR
jgi:hypothetical protein